MFTDKRLTEAYKHAKKIPFDNRSKFVFFSDLHRGDDSVSDEFTRNQAVFVHALDYYYENGYTYVEVGDGDELWEYPDFKHIRLAHGDVFTVLKKLNHENRFLLLYGNHNIYLKNNYFVKKNLYRYYDEYQQIKAPLFPGIEPLESLVLRHRQTRQELFVVHGHQGDFTNDQAWPFAMLLLRYFWRYLHVVGFRNPSSPARNLEKRHKIERNYKKWIRKHKRILICGHTHRPRFPRSKELPYFNTGCGIHTKGITGIEIVDDEISMIDWRLKADKNGSLHIVRTVIRGPEPIIAFR